MKSFNYTVIGKVIAESLILAGKGRIWKWLITGGFGSLLGLLSFARNFLSLDINTSLLYGILSIFFLYVVRFFLFFIKNCLKYFHEIYFNSIYGEAIILLSESFATAHHYRKTPGHQDKEFMQAMLVFCNNLKKIFDSTTASECCVSIKVPLEDKIVDEKTVLVNLCRDIYNKRRDTKEYQDIKHTLIGNTAFSSSFYKVIKGQSEKIYINRDVNNSPNYDNTSKECHVNGILPYNSELVHPIVPKIGVDVSNYNCHGFICIDSPKKNAFKTKYETAMLEGVADGIYDLIFERNQSKING